MFDVSGRLVESVSPPVSVEGDPGVVASAVTAYGYDVFGDRSEVRDPVGGVTRYGFNRAGWRTSSTSPSYVRPVDGVALTATSSFAYDLAGRLVESVSPGGGVHRVVYDSLGRVVRRENPGPDVDTPAVSTTRFDDAGRAVESVSPSGLQTVSVWDGLDRLTSRSDHVAATDSGGEALVSSTSFGYDDGGNLVERRDPDGGVWSWSFDVLGDLLTSTSAAQNATPDPVSVGYSHDGLGRTVGSTDETGRESATVFDGAGRVVRDGRRDIVTGGWLWSERVFDGVGNVVSEATPRGVAGGFATTFNYDPAGRLVGVVEPVDESLSVTSTFGYDLAGRSTVSVDGRGVETRRSYNSWGSLESTVEPATSGQSGLSDRTFRSSYDVEGRRDVLEVPGGVRIDSVFDGAGNVVSESGSGGGKATASRGQRFDVSGNVVWQSGPDGGVDYSYDQRGLLTSTEGPPADRSPRIGGSHVSDGAGEPAGAGPAQVHRRVQA
ncbi:MAG: hypothetical protein WBA45_15165 [Microthrixaceae bacterium]